MRWGSISLFPDVMKKNDQNISCQAENFLRNSIYLCTKYFIQRGTNIHFQWAPLHMYSKKLQLCEFCQYMSGFFWKLSSKAPITTYQSSPPLDLELNFLRRHSALLSLQKLHLKNEDLWRKKFQTKNVLHVILSKNDYMTTSSYGNFVALLNPQREHILYIKIEGWKKIILLLRTIEI